MESVMPNFSQEHEAVAPQSPDPIDEVIRLQTEFNRVQDLYLRALADLDNFRKKVQQDHAKIAHLKDCPSGETRTPSEAP